MHILHNDPCGRLRQRIFRAGFSDCGLGAQRLRGARRAWNISDPLISAMESMRPFAGESPIRCGEANAPVSPAPVSPAPGGSSLRMAARDTKRRCCPVWGRGRPARLVHFVRFAGWKLALPGGVLPRGRDASMRFLRQARRCSSPQRIGGEANFQVSAPCFARRRIPQRLPASAGQWRNLAPWLHACQGCLITSAKC